MIEFAACRRIWCRRTLLVVGIAAACWASAVDCLAPAGELRAGCALVDVSPRVLPAVRNGGFLEASSDKVDDPLHARCLVLADGRETLAIVIVDSCMIPRDVCDEIKLRAARACGIAPARMLIAATHTHSAPSLMDYCLGCCKDPVYADSFVPRVVEGIAQAHAALAPAQAGWTVVDAPDHTHNRRWLHRPEDVTLDPFGEKTVRAMMHPGYQNPKFSGPSGPVDTALTLLSVQTLAGRPLCVLANYSMHYFGGPSQNFSADYFGEFAGFLEEKLAADTVQGPRPLAIMSQGTSGDLHWMDYGRGERKGYTRQEYSRELGQIALAALAQISYRRDVELAMAEARLTVQRRQPSEARLRWAELINARRGDRRPKDLPEVYAEQAAWLHDHPQAELVLQAVRVGGLGLTAIPNEIFAITGLKLKAQSPLVPVMHLELANGAEGYIPPPEQHFLGGYTTWPARSAALVPQAEPRIVETVLGLLEQVSGGKRRRLDRDFYTTEQRQVIDAAARDDNNRENRGAAAVKN
jgi:hypothetical protein